jgi:hypothetical protein
MKGGHKLEYYIATLAYRVSTKTCYLFEGLYLGNAEAPKMGQVANI